LGEEQKSKEGFKGELWYVRAGGGQRIENDSKLSAVKLWCIASEISGNKSGLGVRWV
jgi:hypothetical protein